MTSGIKSVREAAVSGYFYPDNSEELIKLLGGIVEKERHNYSFTKESVRIFGGVIPHAAHFYSGYQAVHYFMLLEQMKIKPDTFIIIHPNHRAKGVSVALSPQTHWQSPLGEVSLDKDMESLFDLEYSRAAHANEHSGEVIVPIIQYFATHDFKILPISMGIQNLSNAKMLAKKIFTAAGELGRNVQVLASSDFSHFLSPEAGRQQDEKVLEEIISFNTKGVEDVVRKYGISVCGYGPIMTLMEYAKLCSGKPQSKILRRGHSGEVVAASEVVDYISMVFFEDT